MNTNAKNGVWICAADRNGLNQYADETNDGGEESKAEETNSGRGDDNTDGQREIAPDRREGEEDESGDTQAEDQESCSWNTRRKHGEEPLHSLRLESLSASR